jgi:hypothetical protein
VIQVHPRARRREDRTGDPLDGLVNLFDLGIVLAVAFLLAALASLHLSGLLGNTGGSRGGTTIVLRPGQRIQQLPHPAGRVIGPGTKVGSVYRLPDGRLVLVTPSGEPSRASAPSAPPASR